uniref:Uncharacterized protein n=1 Tax=uncultured marine virus TaxID=186617 RepID=A0A0F7L5I1_9VIRU|nr:hypothetical protein [uncultured marine virus]
MVNASRSLIAISEKIAVVEKRDILLHDTMIRPKVWVELTTHGIFISYHGSIMLPIINYLVYVPLTKQMQFYFVCKRFTIREGKMSQDTTFPPNHTGYCFKYCHHCKKECLFYLLRDTSPRMYICRNFFSHRATSVAFLIPQISSYK